MCRRVGDLLEDEAESPASQKNRKPPQILLSSQVDLVSSRVILILIEEEHRFGDTSLQFLLSENLKGRERPSPTSLASNML